MQKRFDDNLLRLVKEKGAVVILAVSGGRDSMFMASLFRYSFCDIRPVVAHVNFHLRGEDSRRDYELVRDYVHDWGVPFETVDFDTVGYAREKGISIEMAARELRYSWFYELAEKYGSGYIAVAHHLNDRVETLFLNLIRGTGVRGLAGIRERNGKVIRPVLPFTRKQIDEYMRRNRVPFRDDRTNFESDIPRNRIRNVVFPEFEKINPAFVKTVARDMLIFEQASDLLDELFERQREDFIRPRKGDEILRIRIDRLKSSSHSAFWLYRLIEPHGFNSSQVMEVLSALDAQSGKEFFSDRAYLLRDRDDLLLFSKESVCREAEVIEIDALPYENTLDGVHFTLLDGAAVEDFKALPKTAMALNVSKLAFPLKLRVWREGDRFRPLGMRGFKKVSDFLVDAKVDRFQKRRIRVVTTLVSGEEQIVGIAGFRLDDRFKM